MNGSIAYASQSPFILNASLRENIIKALVRYDELENEKAKDIVNRQIENYETKLDEIRAAGTNPDGEEMS